MARARRALRGANGITTPRMKQLSFSGIDHNPDARPVGDVSRHRDWRYNPLPRALACAKADALSARRPPGMAFISNCEQFRQTVVYQHLLTTSSSGLRFIYHLKFVRRPDPKSVTDLHAGGREKVGYIIMPFQKDIKINWVEAHGQGYSESYSHKFSSGSNTICTRHRPKRMSLIDYAGSWMMVGPNRKAHKRSYALRSRPPGN